MKSLYLTPGSKLVVPSSISLRPNWKMTQILEHLLSNLIP